jgi:methionyl-tRNA formyltransferase
VLTDNEDRHFFFANALIEQTGAVVGVITRGKYHATRPVSRWKKIKTDAKKIGLWKTFLRQLGNMIFRKFGSRLAQEKLETEREYFGGSKEVFFRNHASLHIAEVGSPHLNINDAHYVNIIRRLNPSIIAVMGTRILKSDIIHVSPLVLNIHTGISPYYRGGNTNLWPIVKNDYGYLGVTIHKLSTGIDDGDIIFTARPSITYADTFSSVNCKSIVLGSALMIKAIQNYKDGELSAIKQWEEGQLFHTRHMSHLVAFRYFSKKKNYFRLHEMLARVSGFPNVKLISNGK